MGNIEDTVDRSGIILMKDVLEQGFSKFQLYSFIE